MDYLLGGAIGGLIAFVFSIPAIVLEIMERGKVANVPLLVDVRTIFGRKLVKEEVFLVGLFLHIVFGFLFGVAYVLFALQGWLFVTNAPFTIHSFIVFALLSWVVAGVVIYPALGMGLFGRKEGAHVWTETLTSHLLIGFTMWVVIHLYQPAFFVLG